MPGRLARRPRRDRRIAAPGSPAGNPAFDVTPARLVTGFITERGVCPATREGLLSLYPERAAEVAACSNLHVPQKKMWQKVHEPAGGSLQTDAKKRA